MSQFYGKSLDRSRRSSANARKQGSSAKKKDTPWFGKIPAKNIKNEADTNYEAFLALSYYNKLGKTPGSSRVRLNHLIGLNSCIYDHQLSKNIILWLTCSFISDTDLEINIRFRKIEENDNT